MLIRYTGPRKISIVLPSKNRYILVPGETIEITDDNFKDVYFLIRSHVGEYILIQGDPEFNSPKAIKVKTPGVTTLEHVGKSEIRVKITTKKMNGTTVVEKKLDEVVDDIDKIVKKTKQDEVKEQENQEKEEKEVKNNKNNKNKTKKNKKK